MKSVWGYALAMFSIQLLSAAAQSTDSINAQNVFNLAGTVYNRTGSLLPLHFNLYQIPVPSNVTDPDILITLNSTSGGTGLAMYCNPQYGSYSGGSYPGPGSSIWISELSSRTNQIFISKNDPYYKSSAANASSSQIPFLCSVINSDVNTTTAYTLQAAIVSDNRTLDGSEQNALAGLFSSCCSQTGACGFWKAQNAANSTNANGGAIMTDFCSFPGQVCSPTGNLYRLDMTNYNLSCAWPSSALGSFSQLSALNLGLNPLLTGNTSTVFASVANISSLQFLDLEADTGITGGLDNATATASICKAVKAELASINLNGVGLQGSIPSCLFSSGSELIALDLGFNRFTGSISDSIPPGSSLQFLHVQENQLTGTLPSSLANATYLVDLNVTNNKLQGTIPGGIGAIVPLQSFQAALNNFSGAIPDSFGVSSKLEQFDVKMNHLTALPSAWTNASHDAINSSYVNIRASFNNITGPFPVGLVNAQQLNYLVLNSNQMSGSLPTNDSMFISLRALNISANAFNGSIPPQFNGSGIFSAAPVFQFSGQPLQQVFDLSYNRLSGALPTFLAKQNVPSWTVYGIYLQNNNLTVDCHSADFNYLASVCPNGNQTTVGTQVALTPPALALAPKLSPVQGTPSGIPSLPTPPPAPAITSTNNNNASAKENSGGGLSSGAIAGIVVGVLVAIAVAAVLAFVLVKRRKEPMMPRTYDSSSFAMPNFGDGEFGRKSSLRKGLNTFQSQASSGFERFDDEPQGAVELSHSASKT